MKQTNLFREDVEQAEGKYTAKVTAPIYEPKNVKPHVLELCDKSKYTRLVAEINASSLPEDEKEFLRFAAARHIVFNYERIAAYFKRY